VVDGLPLGFGVVSDGLNVADATFGKTLAAVNLNGINPSSNFAGTLWIYPYTLGFFIHEKDGLKSRYPDFYLNSLRQWCKSTHRPHPPPVSGGG
jgi:hypothetical protein